MELLPLYERAIEKTGTLVAEVTPDQFGDPTPCTEWDTKALLNHIIGGAYMWGILGSGGTIDFEQEPPDFTAAGAAGSYQEAVKGALDAFRAPDAKDKIFDGPVGPLPGDMALFFALEDIVVHGWDLATATGQEYSIDEDIASAILERAQVIFTPESRGSAFKPEVKLDTSAAVSDRLLSFLGRNP